MLKRSIALLASIFWMLLPISTSAQAAGVAARQLGGRQQASIERCEKIKAQRGAAYKEGDCKTFFEQLDEDKPGWRSWALAAIILALVGPTIFNLVFRKREESNE